jgi:hypothetical protein
MTPSLWDWTMALSTRAWARLVARVTPSGRRRLSALSEAARELDGVVRMLACTEHERRDALFDVAERLDFVLGLQDRLPRHCVCQLSGTYLALTRRGTVLETLRSADFNEAHRLSIDVVSCHSLVRHELAYLGSA